MYRSLSNLAHQVEHSSAGSPDTATTRFFILAAMRADIIELGVAPAAPAIEDLRQLEASRMAATTAVFAQSSLPRALMQYYAEGSQLGLVTGGEATIGSKFTGAYPITFTQTEAGTKVDVTVGQQADAGAVLSFTAAADGSFALHQVNQQVLCMYRGQNLEHQCGRDLSRARDDAARTAGLAARAQLAQALA